MRIGIVGLGFMGAAHLRAWQTVPDAQLAAVASSDALKLTGDLSGIVGNLDRRGEQMDFGEAARYRSAQELIEDPTLDAVDLCTPSYLHADQAVAALEAGKHVLVEKPMALSDYQCRWMLDAAARRNRVLMVGHLLRFWPDYTAALDLVRSGSLGKLRSAFLRRKCAAPTWSPWLRDKSKSGGAVLDLLIHDFDFCRQLLGMPETLQATGVEDEAKGIDLLEARLSYGNDSPQVVVSGGWHHTGGYPFSMEFTLICDEGTLDFRDGDRPLTLHRTSGESETVALSPLDAFEAEMTAFATACREGVPSVICAPQESADAVAMAYAADLSRSRGGESVSLGECA